MSIEINGHKFKVLIPSPDITSKVVELGNLICLDYKGKDLVLVCVLKGGLIFLADLIRNIDINAEIDFIRVSSYKDAMKPGDIELINDITIPLKNRDVLLVEDLIDSGATLYFMRKHILSKHPKSLKICTLIRKNKSSQINIEIDYVGFVIEDSFIVGYGTDYAELGRNLADIYVIED